jgi:hypothetical protein
MKKLEKIFGCILLGICTGFILGFTWGFLGIMISILTITIGILKMESVI